MERGIIKSYDESSGMGTIGRNESMDVSFSSERIIGKDRNRLRTGDAVWFEVENIQNQHVAINIRKCIE